MSMKEMWENDLEYGYVEFDSHFNGYLYDFCGDEIFLGETEKEAYETYCDINK